MSRPVNPNVPEDGFKSKKDFNDTGTINYQDFAISSGVPFKKQIVFDPSAQAAGKTVTIAAGANANNITLTLPTSSGTLATTASGSASFGIVQPDSGTSPTATVSGDTLTLTSGDVTVAGNSATNTVTMTLKTVNSNVGSFGSTTAIPNITINEKGLITAASTSAVVAPAGTLSGNTLAAGVTASSLTSLGTQAADLNMGSHKITSVTDPSSAQDAATKNYVDTKGVKVVTIVDQKTSGTDGGTATSGSWQTRILNTLTDSNTGITVSSNQLSIPAGTYYIWACQPFHGTVNRINSRLYNITDSAVILDGSSVCETTSGITAHTYVVGIFTLSDTKTVELQYQVQTTLNTTGLGFASGGIFAVGHEVYTQVSIFKIA